MVEISGRRFAGAANQRVPTRDVGKAIAWPMPAGAARLGPPLEGHSNGSFSTLNRVRSIHISAVVDIAKFSVVGLRGRFSFSKIYCRALSLTVSYLLWRITSL